jgi:RNA polymerase sigma-70 factor, ECF subfamily
MPAWAVTARGELTRNTPNALGKRLLKAAKRGEEAALEELAARSWRPAFILARSVLADDSLAEDVAQEAVLAAIRALDTFDTSRPYGPWLHRIVYNRCRDQLRSKAARREQPLESAPEPAADSPHRGDGPLEVELRAALLELDPRQRAAVTLRHLLGYRAAEIGLILETTETNARTLVHRGLAALRVQLSGDPESEKEAS